MGRLAIIAGDGALPRLLARHCAGAGMEHVVVTLDGAIPDWCPPERALAARYEKLGALFGDLAALGCDRAVFAGSTRRPQIDMTQFDHKTMQLMPRLLARLGKGDDALLREVAAIFEDEGMRVLGVHEVLPTLLADSGAMGRHVPSAADLDDIARAAELAAMLGSQDVGQGAVVAQGLCLGLETLQGTDAMLDFVARTAARLRPTPDGARGVLFKGPKPGQDRRMDLPAIGSATVEAALRAGLAGIAVAAGRTLLIERDALLERADAAGLFVYGLGPGGTTGATAP